MTAIIKRCCRAGKNHFSSLKHDKPICEVHRGAHILLHEKHDHACGLSIGVEL